MDTTETLLKIYEQMPESQRRKWDELYRICDHTYQEYTYRAEQIAKYETVLLEHADDYLSDKTGV